MAARRASGGAVMTAAVGQATPFSDASEYNSLEFQMQRVLDDVQTMSIVEVLAVNPTAMTVDVVVLVNLLSGAGISVPHGRLGGRPYYRLQGGTNGIICDPAVDDIGMMVFASRDLSAVISNKGAANPASGRRFSWSDGVYLGGVLNTPPTQYIKFLSGGAGINIVTPGTLAVTAPATTVSGTANVAGNVTLQAALAVTGASTLTGAVSAPGGITVGAPTGGTAAPGTINATGLFVNGVAVSTGGGGGGGTVTSVGSGTGLTGGPITTSGTIALSSASIAALALATTALQSISIATGTGLTGGPLGASGSTVSLSAATIASLLPSSPVQGDIVYYNGSSWVVLAPGTAGQILQTNGAGSNPTWVNNGGGSTPVPATIKDLAFWISADIVNVSNVSGGITQSAIADRTPWRTGAVATLTGSTVNISNTQLNGLNVWQWPSSNIMPLNAPFSLKQGCTYFIVFQGNFTTAIQAFTGATASGGMSLYLMTASGSQHIGIVNPFVAIVATSTASWTVGTWYQANVTYNPTTGAYAFRQARTAANSGTSATLNAGTTPQSQIGGDDNSEPLNNAFIAELIAYDRVLTSGEITSVENYLNSKWGV
jgi:hypothetical protein